MSKSIFHRRKEYTFFWCPGCKTVHMVDQKWKVDYEMQTIAPSVRVSTPLPKKTEICHSFVRSGKIQYLSDSTHELAGKTVVLPEFEMDEETGTFERPKEEKENDL